MTAVVGWAWRTPLGSDVDAVLERVRRGERAGAPDALGRVVAAIPGEPKPSRHGRYLRRMGLFGVEVAVEALARSGVEGGDRLALFAAVGGLRASWNDMMPALAAQRDDAEGSWARGLRDIHPHWLLRHLSNNAHALIAKDLGARGEGATFGGANAGAQALAAAGRTLAVGAADAALVVAYDTLLEPETLAERAAHAAPGVPGEAAAALVLSPSGTALCHVIAADGAGPNARARLGGPGVDTEAAFGVLGAATALVQTIVLARLYGHGIGCTSGPPDLVGSVLVGSGIVERA